MKNPNEVTKVMIDSDIMSFLSRKAGEYEIEIVKNVLTIFSDFEGKIKDGTMEIEDYDTLMTFLMGVATVLVTDKKYKSYFRDTLEIVTKIHLYLEGEKVTK